MRATWATILIPRPPFIVMPAPGPRKARPEDKFQRASNFGDLTSGRKLGSRLRGNDNRRDGESRAPHFAARSGRSLGLAAFVARNGPLDHFVRRWRTAPHPAASDSFLPPHGEAIGGGRCRSEVFATSQTRAATEGGNKTKYSCSQRNPNCSWPGAAFPAGIRSRPPYPWARGCGAGHTSSPACPSPPAVRPCGCPSA